MAKATKNKKSGFNYNKRVNNAVNKVTNQYTGYANTYKKNVNTQATADINASNAQYDASAKSAALRNAVSRRELQRQMYRNGITGGASETSLMNASNNYANQQGKIRSDRVAAQNTIRQKANADIAAFNLSNAQARDTAMQQARDRVETKYQNWLKRKDDLRKEKKEDKRWNKEWKYKVNDRNYQRKSESYTRRAQGYNSVKAINKAIKKAKKNGNLAYVSYLRARRTELQERNWERAHRND